MSLSITSQPPAIGLIGNGLKFKLKKSDYTAGTAASLTLNFGGTYADYADQDGFVIQAGNDTYDFLFAATPDDSGLQLTPGASGETSDAVAVRVINLLKSNLNLVKNYIIDHPATNYVSLTARESCATDYDLDLVSSDIAVITKSSGQAGADPNITGDYRIYIAPLLYAVPDTPLGEDLLPIDDSQQMENDISDYLTDQLVTSFTYPYAGTNIISLPDAVKQYFIRYAEFQDNAFKVLKDTYSAPLLALPGGLRQADKKLLEDLGTDYFSYNDNDKSFLTWMPKSKTTIPGAPERLYFLTQATGLKLMKKAVYAGSETDTKVADITASAYSVIEILCGAKELFTDAELDGMLSYKVWVADATDAEVSEVREFIIDNSVYPYVRILIFQNSFGMYDCLACTGKLTVNDNLTRTVIQVKDGNDFQQKNTDILNTPDYTLNTGWIDKETRVWLQELLASPDVFYVAGSLLLPLLVTSQKTPKTEDQVDLYGMDVPFDIDYSDKRYSNMLIGEGVQFVRDSGYRIVLDGNGNPYIFS